MKRFIFSLAACLSLLATTSWLIVTPAYAATITVSCGSGTITCSGSSCAGADTSGSQAGYCSCSGGGSNDTKTCSNYEEGGGGPAPVLTAN